ncbi:MAG TPA: hypothetical protein VE439_09890 [Anaerolineae bacterium]|jgi:hypothetical protein|nr:hypothetical protein [Anaerolineae bacterium]
MYDWEKLISSSRRFILLVGVFVGAVALTLLFGFFGYIILFTLLGYIIYARGSFVRLPIGLRQDTTIDVLFVAIIASLIVDIVQATPPNDTAEHDSLTRNTSFTTTTDRQAKGVKKPLVNSLTPKEDTGKTDVRQDSGSEWSSYGSTTSMLRRESYAIGGKRSASSYRHGDRAISGNYHGGTDQASGGTIGTKTTTKISLPSTTLPIDTVAIRKQNPHYNHPPLTAPGGSAPPHDQLPPVSRTIVGEPSTEGKVTRQPSNGKIEHKPDKQKPVTDQDVRGDKGEKGSKWLGKLGGDKPHKDKPPEDKREKPHKPRNPEKSHKTHKPDKKGRPDTDAIDLEHGEDPDAADRATD